jgi:hypothetical protein
MTTLAAVAPYGAPVEFVAPSEPISPSFPSRRPKRCALPQLGLYLQRHWQGRLALGLSFWLNSVLSFLMPRLLEGVATALPFSRWPRAACLAVIALWLFVLVIAVWQWVGLWRSAERYAGPIIWTNLAKGFVLVGVLTAAQVVSAQAVPQISEFWRLANGHDHLIDYRVTVSADLTVLEIEGAMGFGVSREMERLLDQHPQIQQVRLNSIGGRIGEAKRLAALIIERQLSTATTSHCLSACVLAFAAGADRAISPSARLGFHQPAFPGWSADGLAQEVADERAYLLARGIAAPFVEQALATPSTALWQPSPQQLLSAGYVTRVTTSG